jgi:hypothetical protein
VEERILEEEKPLPQLTPQPTPEPTGFVHPNIRWNHYPITVYLHPPQLSYREDFIHALEIWEEVTNRTIYFEITEDPDSDIVVRWVTELRRKEEEENLGTTFIKYDEIPGFRILRRAEIELLKEKDGEKISSTDMKNVALHEIGHALGLSHSPWKESIMWEKVLIPSETIKIPTREDALPIIEVYSVKPLPDFFLIAGESEVSKITSGIFAKKYYLSVKVSVQNKGIVNASVKMEIRADGRVMKEEEFDLPYGGKFMLSYKNIPVMRDFSSVSIIVDPADMVEEMDEENNILRFSL